MQLFSRSKWLTIKEINFLNIDSTLIFKLFWYFILHKQFFLEQNTSIWQLFFEIEVKIVNADGYLYYD